MIHIVIEERAFDRDIIHGCFKHLIDAENMLIAIHTIHNADMLRIESHEIKF